MNKKLLYLLAIFIVLATSSSLYVFKQKNNNIVTNDNQPVEEKIDNYLTINFDGKTYNYNQSISTILFLGVDGDQGDYMSGQSDFMSLVIFNKDYKKVDLLSIPRDTMVTISNYDDEGNFKGEFKGQITLAYPYGGISPSACARNSMESTSNMLNGIILDHYITIPLSSLNDLVDVFGEMDLILEDDSLLYLNSKYSKGNAFHVDKTTIETYLRSRNIEEDYSAYYRMKRQQIYLRACLNELIKIFDGNSKTSITKVLTLLEGCNSNLTSAQIDRYMNYFKEFESNGVEFKTIPGETHTTSSFEEYIIDRDALDQMIIELFYK